MQVLQLNADFTPNCAISEKKAVLKVLSGKAETIVESGRAYRSQNGSVAVPSVIRLIKQAKAPHVHRSVVVTTRTVLKRDRSICAYCGGKANTIDHIKPKSRGGQHRWENVVACCERCNFKKGHQLLSEIGWKLLYQPFRPTGIGAWMLKMRHLPDEWRTYLGLPAVETERVAV